MASRSAPSGWAKPRSSAPLCRRQSSAWPDRGAGARRRSHPRIRQGDQIPTAGTTRPMRADHSCHCVRRPEHHPPSRSNRVRRRVRDKPTTQHRRSPGSRETGASSGGRNPAEPHPIPIHPLGAPWPPRSIQSKMLIAISESRRPRRNSVRYPVNADERDPQRKPTRAWRQDQDRRHLRSAFRLIWFNWDIFSDRPLSLTEGIALEVAIEQIKLFLYQQIHEEFGKPDLTAEDREVLGGLTPFQVDAMADELYSRDDLLGRYIRWALLYTRHRYELAEELDQLHGKVGQKSRIVLMTPAIVDFSKWLEDEDQLSIEQQVDVMARVACRKDG